MPCTKLESIMSCTEIYLFKQKQKYRQVNIVGTCLIDSGLYKNLETSCPCRDIDTCTCMSLLTTPGNSFSNQQKIMIMI